MTFVEIPDVFPPTDLPAPDGQVIRAEFPQGSPLELAPTTAVSTGSTWHGVVGWLQDKILGDNTPQPVTVNWTKIIDALLSATVRLTQAIAAVHTAATIYTANGLHSLKNQMIIGDGFNAAQEIRDAQASVDRDFALLQALVGGDQHLHDVIDAVALDVHDQIAQAAFDVLNYAYGTWVVPLQENLAQLYDAVNLEAQTRADSDAWITHVAIPGAIADAVGFLAPFIDDGVQALPLAQTATQWIDDCGEPMCQTQGPKTDLGKLFKALQLSALLALLAELMGSDFGDVENAARTIAQHVAGSIDQFNSMFIEGGRTFGDVLTSWGAR